MNELEVKALKELGHVLVDKILPEVIVAEESRLPDAYKGIVQIIIGGMLPNLQAVLDAKIDALQAGA